MPDNSTTEPPIPHLFMFGCRNAIDAMRGAGLNAAQIGCIIQDIRSVSLNEEFRRVADLIAAHPPHHHTWGQVMREVESNDG